MSFLRRLELLDPPSAAAFYKETSLFRPRSPFLFPVPVDLVLVEEQYYQQKYNLGFAIDILSSGPLDLPLQCRLPSPALDLLDVAAASDLCQFERSLAASSALRRVQERAETEFYLGALADRVSALEAGFERALALQCPVKAAPPVDRKFKWTTEVKGTNEDGVDRKYSWVAVAKADGEKNLKWTAEITGKGKDAPVSRTYTFQTSTAAAAAAVKGVEGKKVKKAKAAKARVVEITDPEPEQGAVLLKRVFAKRAIKGKGKELSPQDAALIIQMSFRTYLIRRSQVLRGLRDLAVAKAKLKEIRALFSNFSYRRRIAVDAEERQRFSEKIIVLLLTVDAIEGLDYMVRAARRSMVNELEAMLEIVDPQPPGKLGSLKRRKFDLPEASAAFQKEMAKGVAEVVQLLNQEDDTAST